METTTLVHRLIPLARLDTRQLCQDKTFSFLTAFVARQTETFQTIAMPAATLLLVLEGTKHIHRAGRDFIYRPGQAFCLPASAEVAVVNEPDPASGMYRALAIGFSAPMLDEARRKWSELAKGFLSPDPTITINPALASAILHTSEALAGIIETSPRVTEQRIQEILLLLAEMGAAPLRPDLKTDSMADAVRMVIRNTPAAPWTATAVADSLCTSEPTLRRHLRQEGTSFRQILAEERMSTARAILRDGHSNVAQAAAAGGYASLSHFANRFRQMYGHLPSQAAE
jgi:AraC-like DNA-binding protein